MARKKGINNKNRNLKKKYIYFFMEGSKNCSEDKYIREYYNQFQDRAVDIGFKFISCGDGSWKNIEKEIEKMLDEECGLDEKGKRMTCGTIVVPIEAGTRMERTKERAIQLAKMYDEIHKK